MLVALVTNIRYETILCLSHQGLHSPSELVHVFENPLVHSAEGRHPLEICHPNLDSGK